MKIGIIGAGRVGCALAIGFKNKGFEISGLYSKSDDSVKILNDRLGTGLENDLIRTVVYSDAVFITVPDGQIYGVAEEISSKIKDIHGKIFIHCSGASTSDELSPLLEAGGHTASLHPIQTFADRENGWKGLEGIYYGFEGSEKAKALTETIVNVFDGKMLIIGKENKVLYHAAASILSNYTVTLAYVAGKLLEAAGIEADSGMKAFMPLARKTLENIAASGSVNSLTGPISRGDLKTIKAHLDCLGKKEPELLDFYKILGEKTVEIAVEKGSISKDHVSNLKELLNN